MNVYPTLADSRELRRDNDTLISAEHRDTGHIPQTTFLARGRIEGKIEAMVPDKSTPIVTL
jgi:hypothetical protein